MYICNQCNFKFDKPFKITEKHGLSTPPYEIICVCPQCKSQDYEKEPMRYCRCCGAKLTNNLLSYCSDACKTKGKKLFKREHDFKNRLHDSPIYTAVRRVDKYNKQHKTKLSYGQFYAGVGKKKKGARKNG